jgi:Thioesterase-like superfamily
MIIHTPRVIASIARGLLRRRSLHPNDSRYVGFPSASGRNGAVVGGPHIYTARAGFFDVDYLGHMNNAASLTHAEYARWEMTATNGALSSMLKSNTHFMVASSAVRFRREVRPLLRRFEIHSVLGGIDDRHFWM